MKTSHVLAGLTALAALAAFSNAQAQEERWPRWYIGLGGGYTYMEDQDVSDSQTGATKISSHDGFALNGQIGYLPSSSMPLLNALRFEAEVTYHDNDIHSVHFANGTSANGSGSFDSTAYMANVYYDFQTGTNWSPYIGGGVGIATLHLPSGNNLGNTNSSDNEFAYQGLVGIGYAPDTIPNTQWTLGYRYLATSNAKFGGATVDYATNSLEAGAKFRF